MPAPRASRQRGVPVAPPTRAAGNPSSTCSSVNISTRPSACRVVVVVRVRLRPSSPPSGSRWIGRRRRGSRRRESCGVLLPRSSNTALRAARARRLERVEEGHAEARAGGARRRSAAESGARGRSKQPAAARRGHPRTGPGLERRGTPRTGRDGARTRPRTRTRRRKETRRRELARAARRREDRCPLVVPRVRRRTPRACARRSAPRTPRPPS